MRRLGQHFLRYASTAKRIAAAVAAARGEMIIEIGGGHGELTAPLFELAEGAGANLMVLEKDPRLAEELRLRFPSLRVIEGDVREKLGALADKLPAGSDFKLAGNLPYYLTGFLLRQVADLKRRPKTCVFMVQKEVAERLAARPPRMNKLAASVQFWAEAKILFPVPRESFSPPPKIDSAVVKLSARKGGGGQEAYFRLVRVLFAQPRQTILNNLVRGLKQTTKQELITAVTGAGIEPTARPQEMAMEQIEVLARELDLA